MHPQLGVEIRQWLVEQEADRLTHDGAADRDALALAAGQLSRLALEQCGELELGGNPFDIFPDAALDGRRVREAAGQAAARAPARNGAASAAARAILSKTVRCGYSA